MRLKRCAVALPLPPSRMQRLNTSLEICTRRLSTRPRRPRSCASSRVRPASLNAAFQAILANATKLCQASYGTLWLCEGDAFRVAAQYGELPRRLYGATTARHIVPARSTSPFGPSHKYPTAGAGFGFAFSSVLHRPRAIGGRRRRTSGHLYHVHRADVQGLRTDWRYCHLRPGTAPFHRQAHRIGGGLRRPGRDRHREHKAA